MFVAWNHVSAVQKYELDTFFYLDLFSFAFQESDQSQLQQQEAPVGALWIREPFPTFQMSTKMKGLLKGLRYISQIFESADEKEQEMQIGFPTDVKHVAHIGWDGPSASSPSWMNEFTASTPEVPSMSKSSQRESKKKSSTKLSSQGSNLVSRSSTGSPRDLPDVPKPSRHRHTADAFEQSGSPDLPKESRRHHSSTSSMKSPLGEDSLVSPSRSTSSTAKQSRRKKTKESSSTRGSPSTRSRSKLKPDSTSYVAPFSDPGADTGSSILNDPSYEIKALKLDGKRGDSLY